MCHFASNLLQFLYQQERSFQGEFPNPALHMVHRFLQAHRPRRPSVPSIGNNSLVTRFSQFETIFLYSIRAELVPARRVRITLAGEPTATTCAAN